MNKGFSFTYWIGKVLTIGALFAPLIYPFLPMGWENLTLGIVLHGVVDYLNQKYHTTA